MSRPMVSIGMPVYNGERYLGDALRSLQRQEFADYELVICDNASSDRTEQICRRHASGDARVRYFRFTEHVGAVSSFNRALEVARAEYFMWAAHDDLWEALFLKKMVGLLASQEDLSIAFCITDGVNDEDKFFGGAFEAVNLAGRTRFDGLRRYLLQPEQRGKAAVVYGLMRREQVVEAGGFGQWSHDGWGSDMHFVFKMLTLGRLHVVPEILFHKRLVLAPSPSAGRRAIPRAVLLPRKILGRLKAIRAYAQRLRSFSAYVGGYRRIVHESRLPLWQKVVLSLLCHYRSLRGLGLLH